jgi:hypothetical protein
MKGQVPGLLAPELFDSLDGKDRNVKSHDTGKDRH